MPQIIKQPSISVCSSLSHGAFWDVSSSPALEPRPGMTSWVPWWSGHLSRIGGSKFGEPTICGRMWSWSILILTSTQMLELHDNIYIYICTYLKISIGTFHGEVSQKCDFVYVLQPNWSRNIEIWLEDINQLRLNSSLVVSTLCQYVSFGFIRNYASPFLAGWFTQLSWWYAAAARNYLILAVWCRKMWAREYGWDMVRPFMREASDAEAPRNFLFISGMMEEIWRSGVHYLHTTSYNHLALRISGGDLGCLRLPNQRRHFTALSMPLWRNWGCHAISSISTLQEIIEGHDFRGQLMKYMNCVLEAPLELLKAMLSC